MVLGGWLLYRIALDEIVEEFKTNYAPVIEVAERNSQKMADYSELEKLQFRYLNTFTNSISSVSKIASEYHCENNSWPEIGDELKELEEQCAGPFCAFLEIDWELINALNVSELPDGALLMNFPDWEKIIPFYKEHYLQPPGCYNGNVYVNGHSITEDTQQ